THSRGTPGRPVPERPSGAQPTTLAHVAHAALDGHPLQLVLGTLAERVRPRRRLLWFAGGVAAVLVTLALAGLPSGRAESLDSEPARGSPTGTAGGSARGSPEPIPSPKRTPSPTQPSTIGGSPAGTGDPNLAGAPILSDDPVVATGALLEERRRCLSTASLACLEGTDQLGSALLDADQSAVARSRGGTTAAAEPDYASYQASLIERTGNSALIGLAPPGTGGGVTPAPENSKPASVLVIKGEAGWRLREIFEY
ncbi:MAG: hypothetical protein QOF36_215, partial [Microbacteriaceae bacterium]|nr:hypothetical protein [Microbacteriaceae bacterium]